MNEFFQRLKQRKLVQWTLAYVAAAFALLQGIDIIAQRFGWPEQTMRFVIVALSVGLFVTLSWPTESSRRSAVACIFAQGGPGRRPIEVSVPDCKAKT